MENVTHSLIGLLLARATGRWVGSLRGAIWAAVLASNLPDADIVLGPFFEDRRLGYLVHHRGYTHTLLGAVALAVVATGVASWRDRAAPRGRLLALSVLAAVLHVGADGWNNYGVHPFWPIDPDWHYGDTIFIVEPLLWCALLPLLWAGRVGRGLWVVATTFLAIVSTVVLGFGTTTGLLAFLLGLTWLQATRPGPMIPLGAALAVLAAFAAGRSLAYGRLRGPDVIDVVLTPRPASPWCWEAIQTTLRDDTYTLMTARVSLIHSMDPQECATYPVRSRTAPLVGEWHTEGDVAWGPAFTGSVSALRAWTAKSCRADSVMRFARAPFYTDTVIGDLRYDFEPELGFAEFELAGAGCVDAPWRSQVARRLLE